MPILDWFNKKEALKTADKTPYKVLVENKDFVLRGPNPR